MTLGSSVTYLFLFGYLLGIVYRSFMGGLVSSTVSVSRGTGGNSTEVSKISP